jgi:hypothetical protein
MAANSFQDWLDQQAPAPGSLSPAFKFRASKQWYVAIIGDILLRIAYLITFLRENEDPHSEATKEVKTADEIARDLLEKESHSLQTVPLPSPPRPLEASKATGREIEATRPAAAPVQPSPDGSVKAAEIFLSQMQEATKRESDDAANELKRLRSFDSLLFVALLIAAGITILVVVVGTVLLFQGRVKFGILAEAVGLLPGSGTLILRRTSQEYRKQINEVTETRNGILEVLQAIQACLLIPDLSRRADAIASLAADLRKRAMKRRRA